MNTNTTPLPTGAATITFTRRSVWVASGVALASVAALAAALVLHRAPEAAPATAPASLMLGPAPDDGEPPRETAPAAPAACAQCGVIESVQAVRTPGQASGVGAVAGGVIGGVLGHQVGGGNGRTAMTVLGAVGGGVAGHEIEKRHNAGTAWRVTVRKDDGTRVTLTRSEPWSVGARVSLAGGGLRPA